MEQEREHGMRWSSHWDGSGTPGSGPLRSPLFFAFSTPNGNSLSAAELTCGMILCLAR